MREEGRGELEGDARVGKRGPPRRQGAPSRTPPRIKMGGKGAMRSVRGSFEVGAHRPAPPRSHP